MADLINQAEESSTLRDSNEVYKHILEELTHRKSFNKELKENCDWQHNLNLINLEITEWNKKTGQLLDQFHLIPEPSVPDSEVIPDPEEDSWISIPTDDLIAAYETSGNSEILLQQGDFDTTSSNTVPQSVPEVETKLEHRCSYCFSKFKTKVERDDHTRSHHESELTKDLRISCKTCANQFLNTLSYESHGCITDETLLSPFLELSLKKIDNSWQEVDLTGQSLYSCLYCPVHLGMSLEHASEHCRTVHATLVHACLRLDGLPAIGWHVHLLQ